MQARGARTRRGAKRTSYDPQFAESRPAGLGSIIARMDKELLNGVQKCLDNIVAITQGADVPYV